MACFLATEDKQLVFEENEREFFDDPRETLHWLDQIKRVGEF